MSVSVAGNKFYTSQPSHLFGVGQYSKILRIIGNEQNAIIREIKILINKGPFFPIHSGKRTISEYLKFQGQCAVACHHK